MELVFTKHVIERMEERKISFHEIVKCLTNPNSMDEEDGVSKYYKVNGKLLIVVCSFHEDYCTIITVIKTSQIDRYL